MNLGLYRLWPSYLYFDVGKALIGLLLAYYSLIAITTILPLLFVIHLALLLGVMLLVGSSHFKCL